MVKENILTVSKIYNMDQYAFKFTSYIQKQNKKKMVATFSPDRSKMYQKNML